MNTTCTGVFTMNLPNKLSILRLILIPIIVVVFYIPQIPYNYLISAVIFCIAAFTDFLDGYIARKHNLVTDFGKFIDPIADKVLVLSAFILILTEPSILGVYGSTFGKIVGGVGVTIIVAREMIVSVLRMIAAGKGIVLAAEKIGKIKTFATDFAIIFLLVSANFAIFYHVGIVLYIISVLLTLYSGIVYLIKNREVFR